MTDDELKTWLAPTATSIRDDEIELLLGWRAQHVPSTASAALRHAIAVLRDVYPHDAGVRDWLERRRPELRGLSALECLQRGRTSQLEHALTRRWNLRVERVTSSRRERVRYGRGISTSVMR
jgi:hypothetical protein